MSGFAVFCLAPRRGGSQTCPSSMDHDTRRAQRLGAPHLAGFRPAGRVPLPTAAKGPKRRRGGPAVASRLQRGHPRTPVYGGYPYALPQKFRRTKYGSGVLFLPGHRALMRCKISACSISPPRLVPTIRGRGCGTVSVPDEAVSMNRDGRVRRPAPTRQFRSWAIRWPPQLMKPILYRRTL